MIDDKDIEKLSEVFATKEDVAGIKEDLANVKEDILEFKNEILSGQDEIIEKLGLLLQEKDIGNDQDKRQKRVLEIHNDALKKNSILSVEEASQIDKLRVF